MLEFRVLRFRVSGLRAEANTNTAAIRMVTRFPSSTLLPFFFLGSLIKTE